jgi:RNA polymerase sigma factor (sigma-70 family)
MHYNPLNVPLHDLSASDEVLWEAFRQGDRDCYQKLYTKYLDALYNYGYKVFPNKAVITDLIQDLFIDLWKYKNNLSQVKNVKFYLFRSLRNRIIKEVERNRYITYDMESEFGNALMVLPFEAKIIETQIQSENKEKLQKAFLALSKRQREVINLLFYEKFSYEEVTSIMSINLRSVYTLVWKALAVLRKELSCLIVAFLGYLFMN